MDWDLPEPFIHRRTAQPGEIDAYGHVNNTVYVVWLDECAWAHSSAVGLGLDTCLRLQRGMAVHRTQVHYIKSALAGDEIEVGTWPVLNDNRLRIDRRFQVRRKADGETLLRALLRETDAGRVHVLHRIARCAAGAASRDRTLSAGRGTALRTATLDSAGPERSTGCK
jgi:acyl-CoA thioester hydrolase